MVRKIFNTPPLKGAGGCSLFITLLLTLLPITQLFAQEISFKVSAPPTVSFGAQFKIDYSINSLNCVDFRLPTEISENFDVLFGPAVSTAEGIQIINGRQTRTSSTTYIFTLAAKKEGTFNISAATVKIGNSEFKSSTYTINVLPQAQTTQPQAQGGGAQQQSGGGNAASSNQVNAESVFMRMIVSKRNVFEQEGFLVTFKIYSAVSITRITPKFPEFEGFHAQEIDMKEFPHAVEQYNGRDYNTWVVKQTVLYPQRSGQLTIGSGKVEVDMQVRTQARVRSIFADFFDAYQTVSKEIVSSPATIEVKPLPPGKPANYSNAVGSYKMVSSINRTEMKANEAVTIKLTITGNGNIKLLKTPEVKFPNDFEVYDPKPELNIRTTADGVSGTKTIEYMAIPRFAGDFEIPPISFSYFDLPSGTYKTLSTDSWQIHVARDESSPDAPVMSNFTNRENLRLLGKDIRYLKTQKINFQANKDIFFGSFLYVMIYLIMSILFVVFFFIYRKQMKENANIALVRTRKANKTAVRRLKQAERLLHENKEEAFYEEVLRALWGYLSDKLNMPQSELTKENVAAELTKYGVDEKLSGEFLEIINTCEFARYAPSKASGAMDKLFAETINAIGAMENTITK